jgi:hypothetical protein
MNHVFCTVLYTRRKPGTWMYELFVFDAIVLKDASWRRKWKRVKMVFL